MVEQYALRILRSASRFSPRDGRSLRRLVTDRLFSVLVAVYGLRVAEAMVPLAAAPVTPVTSGSASSSLLSSGPGLASPRNRRIGEPSFLLQIHPTLISLFVNRRWVQSRTLTYAIEEAYHSLLLAGGILCRGNITIDPALAGRKCPSGQD